MTFDINTCKKIHFVGIGGSSMHGLAEFALKTGHEVSGSDMKDSRFISNLREMGASITCPHSADFIEKEAPDAVVYTVAVSDSNPEMIFAKEHNIPLIDRSVFLGMLMNNYKTGICVAGTHGKSSTTSMISSVLFENELEPAIHIGAFLPLIKGNTYVGEGDAFVTEACEYHESFLNFKNDIAVILNVEHDHVDYFPDFECYKEAYRKFIRKIPRGGTLVICMDDAPTCEVAQNAECNVISYSLNNPHADFYAGNITFSEDGYGQFDVYSAHSDMPDMPIAHINLSVPGTHNISNAVCAIAVASLLGIDAQSCASPLHDFGGADRRFQFKGREAGITVYDDYAHHPTEVIATLESLSRICPKEKSFCVFQPHTYSRTLGLFDKFKESFGRCGRVIVTDIYAAREKDPGTIKGSDLAAAINRETGNAIYISDFKEIVEYLKSNMTEGSCLVTIGAGDVTLIGGMLLDSLKA